MTDTPISVASQESDATAYLQVLPTPLYLPMLAACPSNQWGEWNGFTVPEIFTTIEDEYEALHNAVGVTDISPLARYRIKGPDAIAYSNRLLTVDASSQAIGQIVESPMCDMRGGVVDVVELLRMAADEFWLVSEKLHLPWLLDSAIGFDIAIDDMTQNIAALRISGPSSLRLLETVGAHASSEMPESQSHIERLGETSVRVLRKSGHRFPTFDLWTQTTHGQSIWSLLSHRKGETDLHPIGTAVMEMLRVEEGRIRCSFDFLSSSHSLDPSFRRSPIELGLGDKVDFDKGYFNGRQALLDGEPKFSIVGLNFQDAKVASGESLGQSNTNEGLGTVLSTTWSPTLKSHIALAEVDLKAGTLSSTYEVAATQDSGLKTQRIRAAATVVTTPFLPEI